jgi:uncharacterized protein YbjT (DUF2867 family)
MILVTGATGLSGSMIVREFAKNRIHIRALVRNLEKASTLGALPTVEMIEGNMLQPETLKNAFKGVSRVLMISSARERMLETQCTFIDAAKAAGVEHIVKFSGKESGVNFDPKNFRSIWEHVEIEKYLENSGLAWTHLRPSQFMQFYLPQSPTGVDISKNALILPMERAKLSPVDVKDIAQVAVKLLSSEGHEGKSYDMKGPEALTMDEVAERVSQAVGMTIQYINVSLEEKKQALLAGGLPSERVDVLMELLNERRKSSDSRVYLGTHEQFGVQPTTFMEFARRNAAIFLGNAIPV